MGEFSDIKYSTCVLAKPVVTVTLNTSGKPVLSWNKVDGAVKYEVYRATSSTGTYTKLTTITGTKLTNTSAVVGTTYYYKVRAVSGENMGEFSEIKSIKSN